MVSRKSVGLFDRWNLNDKRYVWGTCTRHWGIRIVGPLDHKDFKTGRFYVSIHTTQAKSKAVAFCTGLMKAKREAIVSVLQDVPEIIEHHSILGDMPWGQLKQLLRDERQRLLDEITIAAIAGKTVVEFY